MPAPQTWQVTFLLPDGSSRTIEVGEEELILFAAYRAGLDLPGLCLQGWDLVCAGQVEGAGEWDQSASRRYYAADRQAGFILLCTAKPRSNLRIRTHRHAAMRDFRIAHRLPTPRA